MGCGYIFILIYFVIELVIELKGCGVFVLFILQKSEMCKLKVRGRA